MANTQPTTVPVINVDRAGSFLIAINSSKPRGASIRGLMVNVWSRVFCNSTMSLATTALRSPMPSIKKILSAIIKLGTVVHSICCIWLNKLVPVTPEARLVVSDKGDSLSPKYAPEIMAPALIARDISIAAAIPIKPMPRVPATVHELPILNPTKAQTRQEVI